MLRVATPHAATGSTVTMARDGTRPARTSPMANNNLRPNRDPNKTPVYKPQQSQQDPQQKPQRPEQHRPEKPEGREERKGPEVPGRDPSPDPE
jgi:hypothetical protein